MVFVDNNFAFGDADKRLASSPIVPEDRKLACFLGTMVMIGHDSPGPMDSDQARQLWNACHEPPSMPKDVFNTMDKNQYDLDQAERDADTG